MIRYVRKAVKRTSDRGASAVEYGLMVAGIAAVIAGVVFALGGVVKDSFTKTADCIAQGNPGFVTPTLANGSPDPSFTPANCTPPGK